MWEDLDEFGHLPTMTAEQRALQWRRLEGLGEEPTQEELGDMRWPQRCWWEDRDKIGECASPSNPRVGKLPCQGPHLVPVLPLPRQFC